jgi:hypothetical protein
MTYYIVKIVISAILIVAISEISKRSSLLGALLASYPGLEHWMQQMQARPSARVTSFHSTGEAEDGF